MLYTRKHNSDTSVFLSNISQRCSSEKHLVLTTLKYIWDRVEGTFHVKEMLVETQLNIEFMLRVLKQQKHNAVMVFLKATSKKQN